jgi:hypothetical protein
MAELHLVKTEYTEETLRAAKARMLAAAMEILHHVDHFGGPLDHHHPLIRQHYPFNKDLDEIAFRIREWCEGT